MDKMAIMSLKEAAETINRLSMKNSLTAKEEHELVIARNVLENARLSGADILYQAWLGDILLGDGPTPTRAIEEAVAEYERNVGYGDAPHLLPNKEALVAAIHVSVVVSED